MNVGGWMQQHLLPKSTMCNFDADNCTQKITMQLHQKVGGLDATASVAKKYDVQF